LIVFLCALNHLHWPLLDASLDPSGTEQYGTAGVSKLRIVLAQHCLQQQVSKGANVSLSGMSSGNFDSKMPSGKLRPEIAPAWCNRQRSSIAVWEGRWSSH
jgi:hypothetical protein